jgi:hypothetical protein
MWITGMNDSELRGRIADYGNLNHPGSGGGSIDGRQVVDFTYVATWVGFV